MFSVSNDFALSVRLHWNSLNNLLLNHMLMWETCRWARMVWSQPRIFILFIFCIPSMCTWQHEISEDGQKNQEQLATFSSRSSAHCVKGSNWGCTWLRTLDTPTSSQDNLSEEKQKCKPHIHCWGNKLDIFCRKGLQRKLHRWLGNGKMSCSGALWPQDH